jgi:Peptidase family C25
VQKQSSGYVLNAQVPWGGGTHTLLAVANDEIATPTQLIANQPSDWHRRQAGAQEVMISPADFSAGLQSLVRLRESQGKSVAVVSIEDIYDEFNFGERSPYAIRDFLQNAIAVWRQKPAYLLLVGDASIDPRDYLGLGFFDFVPTALVPTAEMMTASDDWFSDFNNTGFAQIETGRIPARSEAGVQLVVSKIVNYETNADSGSWTKQAVLVADPNDDSGSFTDQAQTLQTLLPSSIAATDIFLANLDPTTAQQDVLNSLNSGALFVNFNGHGSVEVWSTDNLMDDTIAGSLSNGSHLPVFFIMNCLNGYFQDVYTESLAEALLFSPNGGAVAVWASSGLTSPGPQFQMDQTAVQTLFSSPGMTLGDAIKVAKQGITDSDVRRTFLLFGDPLMRLKNSSGHPVVSSPVRRISH